ncbi:MAG: PEP-CTERM sorting domain-containing protein [Verrucomicrobiales bacterium]
MLDSVGQLGRDHRGSAIYLGSSWILTAYHAFESRTSDAVIFAGKEYQLSPARAVRLKNPESVYGAEYADLVMVPLLTEPNLPVLRISEQTPFASELVVMVGCGETAIEPGSGLILTDSESQPLPLVRPISDDSPKVRRQAGPRWGENEIAERDVRVGIPGRDGETRAFVTIRQPYWTPHNAQGAAGDSGGGVFVRRGEQWQLAGVMLSVLHREDLNASGTFMADLSVYREQIEATIPEPSAGLLLMVAAGFLVLRRHRCA